MKHLLKSLAVAATVLTSFNLYASDPLTDKNPHKCAHAAFEEFLGEIYSAKSRGDNNGVCRYLSELMQSAALRAYLTQEQREQLGL